MIKLRFIGTDNWDRPVYKDEAGKLWKDVNLGHGEPYLHSSSNNDFDGEPDMPIKGEFEIVGGHERMNVLLVKPNEYAVEAEIENSLKALQKAVGGHIEIFTPGSDPVVYVLNEEGKAMGLDANRALYDHRGNLFDVTAGTFLVCGVEGDDFTDLSPELMAKYKQQFHAPEMFMEQGGKIRAIKIDPKKSIAAQLAEGAKQAAKDNAARPAPDKKDDKDR